MKHRRHFAISAGLIFGLIFSNFGCGGGYSSSSGSSLTSGTGGGSTGTGSSGGSTGTGSSGGSTGTGSSGGSTGTGSSGGSTGTGSSGGSTGSGTSGGTGGSGSSGGGSGSASSTVGYLYAVENPNAASVVEGFSISSTGSLTPLSPTVGAGNNANDIVADASGNFVFAGNSPGCCSNPDPNPQVQVISYAVGGPGALTVANQQTLPNTNDTLNGLLLDPSGQDLYASSEKVMIGGSISSLQVSSTGEMSSLGPDPTNTIMPGRMALHPNGRYLYAAEMLRHHYPDLGGFELFMRDPATGLVTDTHQTYPGSDRLSDFYVDCGLALGGQYLLGQALDTNKITVWAVDAATGALTVASEIMGNFAGLTLDPSGTFAIATTTDGAVTSYQISSTGTLTQAGTAMAAAGVTHVVTDASGKFVYVESSTTNQIYGFAFDSSTGALTALSGSPFSSSGVPIRMAATVSQ